MTLTNNEMTVIECSDCYGKGTVKAEVNMPGRGKYATAIIPVECVRCSGEGWIEVEIDDEFIRAETERMGVEV
jgi:DnaJ-class molecular chaperone